MSVTLPASDNSTLNPRETVARLRKPHSKLAESSAGPIFALKGSEASNHGTRAYTEDDHATLRRLLEEPGKIDVQKLGESAVRTFVLLEPWYKAKQTVFHSSVVGLVKAVVTQADAYRAATANSLETAYDGFTFAGDAQDLCEALLKGNRPPSELTKFVETMFDVAVRCYDSALETQGQFRSIRVGLMEVTKHLPEIVVEVTNKESQESNEAMDRKVVVLPKHLKNKPVRGDRKRPTETRSFAEILAELNQAQQGLEELIALVGEFVDWWGSMRSDLRSLKTVVPQISINGSNPLRTETIKGRWTTVKLQYFKYLSQTQLIEDYFGRTNTPKRRSIWAKMRDFALLLKRNR